MRLVPALAVLFAAGLAAPALAHTGAAAGAGLAEGIAHPLAGLDHLLAMVAVGLWAGQSGGRALWLLPFGFVAMVALGTALGVAGPALPLTETAILVSLLVLGGLVAAGRRLPLPAGVAVVAVGALLHGHAHGAEIPPAASLFLYAAGLVLATAILHGVGIALAMALRACDQARIVRVGGAVIAASGLLLLAR